MAGIKLPDYTALGAPLTPEAPAENARLPIGMAGTGLEDLGRTEENAGSKLQDMVNIANVNNAMANDFEPKVNALAQNFYSLSGKAAMDAAPQFTQQMQQTMNDTADTLGGQARENFIRQAQGRLEQENYRASTHAGQQAKQYFADSSQAVSQNFLSDYSTQLFSDPNSASDAATHYRVNTALTLKKMGYSEDDPIYKASMSDAEVALEKARQGAIQQHIYSLPLVQQVKAAQQLTGGGTASSSAPAAGTTFTPQQVSGAILGHESGGNPNAPDSAKGAIGQGQIMPGTFEMYAKPGESIVNKDDNLAVHKRIIDDYMQKYDGDPARVAVAYVSGPGNVAPAGSATPWVKDKNDGNENVSDYVANVQKRLGVGTQYAQNDNIQNDASPAGQKPTYLGQPVPEKLANTIIKTVDANQAQATRMQKQQQEVKDLQIEQGFGPKLDADTLTPHDVYTSGLTPDKWSKWINQIKEGTNKVDPNSPDVIRQRGTLENMKVDDPKGFLSTDLSDFAGKLPAADIAKLQGDQIKMKQGDQSIAAQNKKAKDITDSVGDMLPVAWRSTKDEDAHSEGSAFKGNLISAVNDAEGAGGKPMTRDDIRKLASDMLGKVSVKGTLWDSSMPAYEVPPGTPAANVYRGSPSTPYVPESFRQGFTRAWQAKFGKPPQDTDIANAYLKSAKP